MRWGDVRSAGLGEYAGGSYGVKRSIGTVCSGSGMRRWLHKARRKAVDLFERCSDGRVKAIWIYGDQCRWISIARCGPAVAESLMDTGPFCGGFDIAAETDTLRPRLM